MKKEMERNDRVKEILDALCEDHFDHYNWQLIPDDVPDRMYLIAVIRDYVLHGILFGDWLRAVFANDLGRSINRADSSHKRLDLLEGLATLIYNYCPSGCWGSEELVSGWALKGGLRGHYRDQLERRGDL